jgi:tetratricopeptide (TPR) repeat protein
MNAIAYGNNQNMREPMNSEISTQMCIGLCYGAKGIMPYSWASYYQVNANVSPFYAASRTYEIGLVDFDNTNYTYCTHKREHNFYGENKWDYMKTLYGKINTWGPVLVNSSSTLGYSVHNDGANHEFITDIQSILPGINGQNPCVEDNPGGPYMDCTDERFWELGFFDDIGSAKYFMAVNRRCVPAGGSYAGDDRVLRIKFNLPGSNNWKLSEVGNFAAPIEFNKNVYSGFGDTPGSIGWFKPGEGKLFKLEEVPKSGGTLVTDEIISGESFTCEAPVYNNGFNITIGANTTIHFNDSSKFVMSGGVFTVGDQNTSAPQNITSDAVSGSSWSGHSFTNCEVKIYGATFTGLTNDTTYAVNIIDCPVVDIRNCTFNTNSSLKGGINAICFNNPFIAINNIYIGSNTFNSSGSTIPTVNVSSYAGVTTPLIIENNTFNEGNTAVFLSGVIGGAIKGNTITDNYISINALTSSIDVVQNNISSTVSGSMGIFAAGGSELKLNSSGAFTLGGLNNISNEGTGTNNINVDGSYFLLEGGENIFNISSGESSYHLYGYFPMFTAVTTEETNNCFKVDDSPVDPPINMVTSGYQGTQITFNFNPYLAGCEIIGGGDGLAIDLGDGIYDTIYTGGSGSGGSQSSVASELRSDIKQSSQTRAFDLQMAKEKYDSVCVLMRYRSYTQAKTKCLDLINTYPDSIQSIFVVSKLFLATVASDTSYNAANTLKIFYENLILNYPNNTSLVKRANYYILKCKVRMREYSQALAGFQQIINQNPYSYEGLIARWDYMATSLLIQGQGGAYSSIDNEQLTMNNYEINGNDDDKKPFTKEQRQDIRKSINTAIEISKNDDEVKIKKLEEKSELGDVNASKELTQMKSLKQVVKTEKPKSIIEHVRIVSEDIRKVFGTNTSSKGNEPKNLPTVFRISQNYPNPFNPVTKINYDLPKDSKVKIVIYDILGREVKRLVNNELKTAGSYIVDFNASNYASGVYFYRIEAEEPNGNKFVDSKKMVLLK